MTQTGMPMKFLREVAVPCQQQHCLFWPFARNTQGAGNVRYNGQMKSTANVLCELVHGPAPTAKHEAAHSCGNGRRACVNGRHVRWATRKENEADKRIHGTDNAGQRNGRAKLTPTAVRRILALKGKNTQRQIAGRFGVTPQYIGQLFVGKRWGCL